MKGRGHRTATLIMFALAGTLLVHAGPASASFAGHNGLIAFNRGQDIYTATASGTSVRRLTTGGASAFPKWNKAGTKIVFRRGSDVWTMNRDGSQQRKITQGAYPVWSADGGYLYYIGTGPVTDPDQSLTCQVQGIYRVPAAGGARVRIGPTGITCDRLPPLQGPITLSPDGLLVSYMQIVENQYGIHDYLLQERDVNTGTEHTIVDLNCPFTSGDSTTCPGNNWKSSSTYPNYSPGGKNLALGTDSTFGSRNTTGVPKLVLMNTSTLAHRQVSNAQYVSFPSPSPDGTQIIFSQHSPGGAWKLMKTMTTASATTTPTPVLTNASQPDWQPTP